MSYEGSDRRVHQVFVTRNTEYHVRAELCVAVRDRGLGRWRRRSGLGNGVFILRGLHV